MSSHLPDSSQSSSKETSPFVLLGCLVLFGLPFFVVGVGAIAGALGKWNIADKTDDSTMLGWFGVVFAGAGLIMFGIAVITFRRARERAAMRAEHPASPWMWRKDWASGRISDQSGAKAGGLLVFSLLWNVFVIPIFVFVLRKGEGIPILLFLGLFLLIGLALLAGAIYSLLQRQKFGRSYFAITTLPGRPGQSLRGAIETTMTFDAPMTEGAFAVKLLCVNRVTTGSGKHSSTSEHTMWEAESRVPFATCAPGPYGGSMVPVNFDIPDDARPTNDDNPRNAILWKLQSTAELPGIDYSAEWEVPVY
ncbi:MAG: hypothetical protein ACYC7A_10020 [Thermoanaerobaculia bacterium]